MIVRYYILIFIVFMAFLSLGSYALTRAYFSDTAVSASNTFTTAESFGDDSARVGEIVINEVAATGSADWVELYNKSGGNINLLGWRIEDNSGGDDLPEVNLGAGEYAVIVPAGSTVSIPGSAHRIEVTGNIGSGLNEDGDQLKLIDDIDESVDRVSWGNNSTVMTLPVITSGNTLRRIPNGIDTHSAADWQLGTPSTGLVNN